jgi:hypothetical protein
MTTLSSTQLRYYACLSGSKRHRRSGPRERVLSAVQWESLPTAELALYALASLSASVALPAQLRALADDMRADAVQLGRTA